MFDSYVGLRGQLAPVTIAWVIPASDVQVFAPPSCCYVFDLVGTQRAALLQQLQPVLEDPSILKVFHDCRQDSAALKYQAGIRLQHVLDTQVTSPSTALISCCKCNLAGPWLAMTNSKPNKAAS